MHLRRKPWMRPELERSPLFIVNPKERKGGWRDLYERPELPLVLELGCGKGLYLSQAALQMPEKNYLGIDLTDVVLAHARRNIDAAGAKNVFITAWDIERILDILSKEDQIDEIVINFCNPWPKKKHNKKRLVHPRRLRDYKLILKPGARIQFKTDDDELYQDALSYFVQEGFSVQFYTDDLYVNPPTDNIQTEHEKMFLKKGKKIK